MDCKIIWFVTIILVNIPESNGRPLSFPEMLKELQHLSYYEKPVECGFQDLGHRYARGCKEYFNDLYLPNRWTDNVITGEQLLKRISTGCMNYESYRKCAKCTTKRDCPEETEALSEYLMEKWSVFCNGDRIADWLQPILESGMSYNASCSYFDIYRKCYGRSRAGNEDKYNITAYAQKSLSDGLRDARLYTSKLCRCTVGEILYLSETELLCGSSWQDILLIEWLKMSSLPFLGVGISIDEITMLQDMRC